MEALLLLLQKTNSNPTASEKSNTELDYLPRISKSKRL